MRLAEREHNFRNVTDVPPERVPFELITPRQKEFLQYIADGYKEIEIADQMNIQPRTVEASKVHLSLIGYPIDQIHHFSYGDVAIKQVISGLIQDGINNDYLSHKIPDNATIVPLSKSEKLVIQDVLTGMSNKEIASKHFFAIKTVEAQLSRMYKKMGMERHSKYHAVARYTYLVKNGCYPQSELE